MHEQTEYNVKDLTLDRLLAEDDVRSLSFDEILVEALIANTALARTLPKSLAADALRRRIEVLRAEARRRDADLAKTSARLDERIAEINRAIEALEDTGTKKARRRARKKAA